MGNYLITGAAGFIGARTSEMLTEDGHTVVGVDNLNDAYDPLEEIASFDGIHFSST